MNRLITLFSFLLITAMSYGQIAVTVTGTVADVDGNGVGGVDVNIIADSTLIIEFGYYNTVTTNDDGTYSDTFEVPDELTQGLVTAWILNCDSINYFVEEGFWSPGGQPVIDFLYCNVNCSVEIVDTTGFALNALSAGEAPFAYLWNTGETISTIVPETSGTYSVTVTDANGCQANDWFYFEVDCSVEIDTSGFTLSALSSGEAPFSYLWNTGETISTIVPETSGTYCVTATDASGCQANDCFYFEVDVDSLCSVYIGIDSSGVVGLVLTAYPSGEAPFAYYWGTGETTASIDVDGTGEHCLSITDASGCVSSACVDFGTGCNGYVSISQSGPELITSTNVSNGATYLWSTGESTPNIVVEETGEYCVLLAYADGCTAIGCIYYVADTTLLDSCYVFIDLVQGGSWLEATGGGVAPYIYTWSNGSTSNSIAITEDTLYCVTIVDATGCSAYNCYDSFDPSLSIRGSILYENAEDSLVATGVVDLFTIDGDEVTFVTSVESSSYYVFDNLEAGNYVVRAVVDGYLPTYHLSSMWWDEADVITPTTSNQWSNIELIGIDGLIVGPGGITGTVSGPDEFGGHDDDSRDADPIEGAEMILLNSQGEPIAYMFSNADGDYSFENLAYGTYTVYIEIVGYEQVFYTITIGPDNEIANNINFIVDIDNTTIATATREAVLDENLLSIFPNPVKGSLKMNLNTELGGNATVEVINITGQIVFSDILSQYEQQKSIDVSALNTGLYLLKVTTDKGIIVQQFVKQ